MNRATLLVNILCIFVGINSLISTNGLWVELPVMVPLQPEGWTLPAYLTIIIQAANIGPIVYSLAAYKWPRKVTERRGIYVMMIIGILSSFFLIFSWRKTTRFGEKEHSTALFILTFFLALVDTTSSVVCLPYMAELKESYVKYYMIGEGLSGFLPSIVAMAQGVDDTSECYNETMPVTNTTSNTTVQETVNKLRFSSEVFFSCLFLMMFTSGIAYVLLNLLPLAKREHVPKPPPEEKPQTELFLVSKKHEEYSPNEIQANDGPIYKFKEVIIRDSFDDGLNMFQKRITKKMYWYLLFVQFWVSALGYGVFPSIQSYSCLPYGSNPYHLAVILTNLATPLSCVISLFLPTLKTNVVTITTILGSLISCYLMYTAITSPNPPLVGTITGEALMITSWVLFTGLFGYVKVAIAHIMRCAGHSALFWCGAMTQIGSTVGALIMFLFVSVFNTFQDNCGST